MVPPGSRAGEVRSNDKLGRRDRPSRGLASKLPGPALDPRTLQQFLPNGVSLSVRRHLQRGRGWRAAGRLQKCACPNMDAITIATPTIISPDAYRRSSRLVPPIPRRSQKRRLDSNMNRLSGSDALAIIRSALPADVSHSTPPSTSNTVQTSICRIVIQRPNKRVERPCPPRNPWYSPAEGRARSAPTTS